MISYYIGVLQDYLSEFGHFVNSCVDRILMWVFNAKTPDALFGNMIEWVERTIASN